MGARLTIGELSRRTGVPTSTLRYYDDRGLVRPAARESGQRRYDQRAIVAVGVVLMLREVGFTLAEVGQLLASPRGNPAGWRTLAARKLEELRARIDRESAARSALEHCLACPHDDIVECPRFAATVDGMLSGAGLGRANCAAPGGSAPRPRPQH